MSTKELTCEQRVGEHLAGRLEDLRKLVAAQSGELECEDCDGDGWTAGPDDMDEDERIECSTCEGSGKIETEDGQVPDLGSLNEYGLCVDYVAPGTFRNQPEGFLRYQLSTGGPGDEFRFFLSPNGRGYSAHRVEYWFLDWFDGASRRLHGADRALLLSIFEDWNGCESVAHWVEEAGGPGEYADEDDEDEDA